MEEIEVLYKNIVNKCKQNTVSEDIKKIITSDKYSPYNSTFFCLINTKNLSFEYISKWMHHCIGLDEKILKENGLPFFWGRIHPNDLDQLFFAWNELSTFILSKVSVKEEKQISYTWNYRFKNSTDKYVNIIQNIIPIGCNTVLKPTCILSYYTIINSKINMKVSATANVLNDDDIFEKKSFSNIPKKILTAKISQREKDILRLLGLHYTSKEIAEELFISPNTVNTHRRNIINKLSVSSTGELIGMLRTNDD